MSTNDIWAVVPIKELDGAKQRLAPLLTPAQRRALIEVMMNEVLEAVTTTKSLAGVMVVTVDAHATALAKRLGARVRVPMDCGRPRNIARSAGWSMSMAMPGWWITVGSMLQRRAASRCG